MMLYGNIFTGGTYLIERRCISCGVDAVAVAVAGAAAGSGTELAGDVAVGPSAKFV